MGQEMKLLTYSTLIWKKRRKETNVSGCHGNDVIGTIAVGKTERALL